MTKLLISFVLIIAMAAPAEALEMTAPRAPESGAQWMPESTDSFGDGLWEMMQKACNLLVPSLRQSLRICIAVIESALIVSLVRTFSNRIKNLTDFAGSLVIATLLVNNAHSMLRLAMDTIQELSEYGKLLNPVMTTAMAAQGNLTTSTALYVGTAMFDAILSSFISKLLMPMVSLFLALSVANSALGEEKLKNMSTFIKNSVSWCLKTLLIIFTTYLSISGVVSGTTDAAALKAAKVTISSVVPVVGGILSDASEAVLVSAGIMKNAAGIYGIFAILAIFLEPFLEIGIQYLVLKLAAAVCSIFSAKRISGLVDDFSSAMGLLVAMTGSVCLLLLISTVCFMKGVG